MAEMNIQIRTAEAADLNALQQIYSRASLANEGDRAALLANPDAIVLSETAVNQQRTRVACVGGVIVGFATLLRVDDAFELEDLFVDPDWMRRGVGLELMREASAVARANGRVAH